MTVRRILALLLTVGNLLFLYGLLFSGQSIFSYMDMKERRDVLMTEISQLDDANLKLSQEIRWLKADAAYTERVIRGQLNFVKNNEVLYLFDTKNGNRQ